MGEINQQNEGLNGANPMLGRAVWRDEGPYRDLDAGTCVCCGQRIGMGRLVEICPVCKWEVEPGQEVYVDMGCGENVIPLRLAQWQYAEYGILYPDPGQRPSLPVSMHEYPRDPGWRPLDEIAPVTEQGVPVERYRRWRSAGPYRDLDRSTCCCCGYRVGFTGLWQGCPVCGWTVDPVAEESVATKGVARGIDLREAQRNFSLSGHMRFKSGTFGNVRSRARGYMRDPSWSPLEQNTAENSIGE